MIRSISLKDLKEKNFADGELMKKNKNGCIAHPELRTTRRSS
jgi:hypothetical protein